MVIRKIEPWMAKGGAVRMGHLTGYIRTMITAMVGDTHVVLKMYVQPVNVQHAWPVNPFEVESINPAIERPETIGVL